MIADSKQQHGYVNITCHERPYADWQGVKAVHSGLDRTDFDRFWSKVRRTPSGCLEWTASRSGGNVKGGRYGQFTYAVGCKQYRISAHRFAWIVANKRQVPDGLCVCHTCDVGSCVDPSHLFLGDHTENMRDASRKGRLAVPRKRTRAIKSVAVERYLSGGITAKALADEYGVAMATVLRWVHQTTGGIDLRHARSGNRAEVSA